MRLISLSSAVTRRASISRFFRGSLIWLLAPLLIGGFPARSEELTVEFAFRADQVRIDAFNGYSRVALEEGEMPEDAPGTPWLPAKYANVLIPAGASVDSSRATAEQARIADGVDVAPVQPPQAFSQPARPFTQPDAAAYAADEEAPKALATVLDVERLHGYSLVSLRLNPVRYNPARRELRLATRLTITIAYTRPLAAVPVPAPSQRASSAQLVRDLVENPQDASRFSPEATRQALEGGARAEPEALPLDSTAVYLLITNEDALVSAFQQYVDRRTGQGRTGTLITVETIKTTYSGVDTQDKIRACIKDNYQNHGTVWVCLGGDNTIVPDRDCHVTCGSSTEDHMPTDLYYGGLDGTWDSDGDGVYGEAGQDTDVDMQPEVWVGRVPVRTASQANNYFDKMVSYENGSPDAFSNRMLITGNKTWNRYTGNARPSDFREYPIVSDVDIWNNRLYRDMVMPYFQETNLHVFHDTKTSWDTSGPGSYVHNSGNLNNKLNTGYHHVFMATHGNVNVWGMESGSYVSSNASALTNGYKSGFVYTIACITGAFDSGTDPCLSEAFLRNANGGAVGYMGCSRFGWGSPGSTNGGPSFDYGRKFYDQVFNKKKANYGEAFARHKMAMAGSSTGNGANRWVQFGLNCQGDPAIDFLGMESGRSLQIISPDGFEEYNLGSSINIRWCAGGSGWVAGDKVKLEYSTDGGGTWVAITGAASLAFDKNVYAWDTTGLTAGTDYRVRVTSNADTNVKDSSYRSFTLGTIKTITVQSNKTDVSITGTHNGTTNYTWSLLTGVTFSATAPQDFGGDTFLRWKDTSDVTLSTKRTYSFTVSANKTIIAEYGTPPPPSVLYVNDDTQDGAILPGSDGNDGLTSSTPKRTIQAALGISGIGAGNMIYVSKGVFQENVAISNTLLNGIALQGAGADTTVIDGGGTGRCLDLNGVLDVRVAGFTLRNGVPGANSDGGGMRVNNGTATISDCVFTSNVATDDGGGLAIKSYSEASTVFNCRFTSNTASDQGGGLLIENGAAEVTNCVFDHNSAKSAGGLKLATSQAAVANCTLCDNTANGTSAKGGGIYEDATSTATVANCILWGNQALNGNQAYVNNGSLLTVSYSDLEGGVEAIGSANGSEVAGSCCNLADDPQFVDRVNGDYHLGLLSPCVDAGCQIAGLTSDFESNPRPLDGSDLARGDGSDFDIGADEAMYRFYVNDGTAENGVGVGADVNDGVHCGQPMRNIQTLLDKYPGIGQSATIHISTGNYNENVTLGSSRDGLTLQGDGASSSILDGDATGRCLYINGPANVTISGLTLRNGVAPGTGGGILINSGATAVVDGCRIYNNSATDHGGGVHVSGAGTSATLSNCTIRDNTTPKTGGGLMVMSSGKAVAVNCIIQHNSAVDGGGVSGSTSMVTFLANCTIADNTATNRGGGIYNQKNNSQTLVNCIVWGNGAAAGPQIHNDLNSDLHVGYSDLQGGMVAGVVTANGASTFDDGNNIDSDPLFKDTASNNYRLRSPSPCIDAGCRIAWLDQDYEGDPRGINGSAEARGDGSDFDIGADESTVAIGAAARVADWILY